MFFIFLRSAATVINDSFFPSRVTVSFLGGNFVLNCYMFCCR